MCRIMCHCAKLSGYLWFIWLRENLTKYTSPGFTLPCVGVSESIAASYDGTILALIHTKLLKYLPKRKGQ